MRKNIYTVSILSTAMFLAACEDGNDGASGADGMDGTYGLNALVATRDIPKGDEACLGGGLALDSGQDTNGNGVLDADEVTSTEILACEATPTIRALHASPDAPKVNIWVDGAPALPGVDYSQGSGFVRVGQEVNVQVEAILPGDDVVVIEADLQLDYNTETTILAIDTVANISAMLIENDSDSRITDGYFRAQVVHGSPSAPDVDVYVTAFDADLDASAPVNGMDPLSFRDYTGQLEVPAGDYQIRITPAGETAPVVYDSGEVSLGAGADLMIVAIENVFLGDSAVQLVVLDGAAATPLYSVGTDSAVLAVHLSPDAPAVDILANIDSTPEDEALKLAQNVSYGEFCAIDGIPAPVDFTISVVANADNDVVALQFPLSTQTNTAAAAVVTGFLTMGTPETAIQLIALGVDGRSVATESKIRLTHASPSTPNVDIYLLPAGQVPADADAPNFADVPFGADTGVLSIAPGNYSVFVTVSGSTDPAIAAENVPLMGGEVWDILARDGVAANEEMGPQAVIVDYDMVDDCLVAIPTS